jgi:hypothetical protein
MHLQGLGECPSIPASGLRVGMVLSWNYSPRCCEIVRIEDTSRHFLTVVTRYVETGKEYTQRLKKTRHVVAHTA